MQVSYTYSTAAIISYKINFHIYLLIARTKDSDSIIYARTRCDELLTQKRVNVDWEYILAAWLDKTCLA
jgi:hypothetical protein